MRWWLATLSVIATAAAAVEHHLVRIPLESEDHLSFNGAVYVGAPSRCARVVFDTGSSDVWVASDFDLADADDELVRDAFAIGYGGGVLSGLVGRSDIGLRGSNANELVLRDVHLGFVDGPMSVLSGLDAHGVVGLGMEALAQIHANSSLLGLLNQQQVLLDPVAFSLYISSSSGAQPPSQLLLGGDDPALSSPNTKWFRLPVVSNGILRSQLSEPSTKDTFGFWAVQVQSLSFDNVVLPSTNPDTVALLDSGTSVVLLPLHVFDAVAQALSRRFGRRYLSPTKQRSLPGCRSCRVNEFPPLAVDFLKDDQDTRQRFILQGSDYVRCDQRHRRCTAMIDSIQASEISSDLDVMVLGTVFFRVYYARFDYTSKQVGLACTVDASGVCPGGTKPALDYRGLSYEPSTEGRRSRGFVGICAAATALALLAGLQILVQFSTKLIEKHTRPSGPA